MAVLLTAVCLGACAGSSDPGQPIARVGDHAIAQAALAHWASALKVPRKTVLSLLISYQWLIGEAASRAIPISELEVRRQIDRILMRTFPGSIAELREFLKPTGETVADLKLQARAQLALAKLRQMAITGVPAVTQEQIAAYYAQHKRSFVVPERREARFTNRKTKAAALKLKHEVQAGKSLTSPAQRKVGELLTGAHVPPGNEYERAIDSAKPHTVAGPFNIGNDYWLYEVVKIIPARQQALKQVAGTIARQLSNQRRHEVLAGFVKAWSADWRARTDCTAGYVVQGCRQYQGVVVGGEELPRI